MIIFKKKYIPDEFEISSKPLSTIMENSKEIDLNFSTDRKRKTDSTFSKIKDSVAK
jgi:hypothetical protein